MDDLVVDRELETAVVDDQDANATATVAEDVVEPVPEPALIDNGQALLDVARLGHGHDAAVVANVEHAILLEDGAEHVLHDDRRRRVRDEARLLVQLLREEIDAEVAILARLVRDGDADDLARPALEDQEIAEADVVARDRDGVGRTAALDDADALAHGPARTRAVDFLVEVHLLTHGAAMMVRVQQAVDAALDALAERVIMAIVVVVPHLRSVLLGMLYGCSDVRGPVMVVVAMLGVEFVLKVDRRTVVHSTTILALCDVDLRLSQVGTMTVAVSDSDVGVRVAYRVSVDLDVSFRVGSGTTLDVDVGLGAGPRRPIYLDMAFGVVAVRFVIFSVTRTGRKVSRPLTLTLGPARRQRPRCKTTREGMSSLPVPRDLDVDNVISTGLGMPALALVDGRFLPPTRNARLTIASRCVVLGVDGDVLFKLLVARTVLLTSARR